MNINLVSFISLVILGNSASHTDIPEEYSNKPVHRTDDTDVSSFIADVISAQKTGNILVVTNLSPIAELIKAININLETNKIAVLCNDLFETSAIEQEILSRSLHTADGKIFIPENDGKYPFIMHYDNQIILKKRAISDEKTIFNAEEDAVGVLLDKTFRYDEILGTVEECIESLTVSEKARLMLEMLKTDTNETAVFSDILVVKTEKGCKFIIMPTERIQNAAYAELQLFTGITKSYDFCDVIEKLTELSLPDIIFEDISRTVTSIYITHNTPTSLTKLIRNTMERILILEEIV